MLRPTQLLLKAKVKASNSRFIQRARNDPFVRARETGEQPGRVKLPVWALPAKAGKSKSKGKKKHSDEGPRLQEPKIDEDQPSTKKAQSSDESGKRLHLARLVMDDVTSWRARSAFKLMEIQKGTRMLSPPLNVSGGAGVAAAIDRAHKEGRAVQVKPVQHEGSSRGADGPVDHVHFETSEKARVVPWVVVDLGAAPGGWTQVCARALGWWENERGTKNKVKLGWHVFGIDLLPVADLPGATFLRGDFLAQKTRLQLRNQVLAALPPPNPKASGDSSYAFRTAMLNPSTSILKDAKTDQALSGGLVDVCLSDMLGNISGVDARDESISIELVDAAFRFARRTLRWPPPLTEKDQKHAKPGPWEVEEDERFESPPSRGIWEEESDDPTHESKERDDPQPKASEKKKQSQQPHTPRTTYFVAKVYQSRLSDLFIQQVLRPFFERLVMAKPEASRAASREHFIVASGFKGPQAADYGALREKFADKYGI